MADLAPEWRLATLADPDTAIVAGHVLIRPGLRPESVVGHLAAISVAHQTGVATHTWPRSHINTGHRPCRGHAWTAILDPEGNEFCIG